VEAVILILKHATFLRLSNFSCKSALTHAELAYREANINLKIQQFLKTFSQENPVQLQLFSGFIMGIDIGLFILVFVTIIS